MSDKSLPSIGAAPAGAARPSRARALSRRFDVRMAGLAALVGLALSLLSPLFLTPANIVTLLDQSVVTGIVSVGMTFVVLTGGIDLSVGSVAGLTGIILGLSLPHLPVPAAVAAAVAAGGGIGLLSGSLITLFGLPAFAVTLGIAAMGRGLAASLPAAETGAGIPGALRDAVRADILGLPSNLLFLLVLYASASAYLTSAKGGRILQAIGSNKAAARAAGLPTASYAVLPYVLAGALSALAVTVSMGQVTPPAPSAGDALDLDAVAAVLIGGASLRGGRGSMIGTLIGVVILVMIRNGLALLGAPAFWQGSTAGVLIVLALLVGRIAAGSHPDGP